MVDLGRAASEKRVDEFELSGTEGEADLGRALVNHAADLVVDSRVPSARCEVTCRALGAGFPVSSEKPMAFLMEEAHKTVQTSERAGQLFVVSQSPRYNRPALAVRDCWPRSATARSTPCFRRRRPRFCEGACPTPGTRRAR